jgi:putative DNA primase/helicase
MSKGAHKPKKSKAQGAKVQRPFTDPEKREKKNGTSKRREKLGANQAVIHEELPRNDDERGARFAVKFMDELCYVTPWKKWMSYDKHAGRWVLGGEDQYASKMIGVFLTEVERIIRCGNSAEPEKLKKMALEWGNDWKIQAMLNRAEHRLSCEPDQFDSNPMLLGVENGIIDLKTGEHRLASNYDHVSKCTHASYEEKATCPRWEQFLVDIFDEDQGLIDFVQRGLGYSLTGITKEQVLFFLYGMGQNGKSTFVNVILDLLGDYGQKTKSELITQRPFDKEPETLVARLMGARLVVGSEIQAGVSLNAAIVKDLCGGDTLIGRHLYGDHFDFGPTHKIWAYGNYCPVVHDMDKGIWRRIRLIPFKVEVPEEFRDRNIETKLKAERSGILNWLIAGCLNWQRDGLGTCKAVEGATEVYHDEEDEIGEFIRLYCVLGKDEKVTRVELYRLYHWHEELVRKTPKNRIISATLFARRLRRPGIGDDRSLKVNHQWAWSGIGLSSSGQDELKDADAF